MLIDVERLRTLEKALGLTNDVRKRLEKELECVRKVFVERVVPVLQRLKSLGWLRIESLTIVDFDEELRPITAVVDNALLRVHEAYIGYSCSIIEIHVKHQSMQYLHSITRSLPHWRPFLDRVRLLIKDFHEEPLLCEDLAPSDTLLGMLSATSTFATNVDSIANAVHRRTLQKAGIARKVVELLESMQRSRILDRIEALKEF